MAVLATGLFVAFFGVADLGGGRIDERGGGRIFAGAICNSGLKEIRLALGESGVAASMLPADILSDERLDPAGDELLAACDEPLFRIDLRPLGKKGVPV